MIYFGLFKTKSSFSNDQRSKYQQKPPCSLPPIISSAPTKQKTWINFGTLWKIDRGRLVGFLPRWRRLWSSNFLCEHKFYYFNECNHNSNFKIIWLMSHSFVMSIENLNRLIISYWIIVSLSVQNYNRITLFVLQ